MFPRPEKLVFNFGVTIQFFSFIRVCQAQIFGCACSKRKWLSSTGLPRLWFSLDCSIDMLHRREICYSIYFWLREGPSSRECLLINGYLSIYICLLSQALTILDCSIHTGKHLEVLLIGPTSKVLQYNIVYFNIDLLILTCRSEIPQHVRNFSQQLKRQ